MKVMGIGFQTKILNSIRVVRTLASNFNPFINACPAGVNMNMLNGIEADRRAQALVNFCRPKGYDSPGRDGEVEAEQILLQERLVDTETIEDEKGEEELSSQVAQLCIQDLEKMYLTLHLDSSKIKMLKAMTSQQLSALLPRLNRHVGREMQVLMEKAGLGVMPSAPIFKEINSDEMFPDQKAI